MTRFYTFVDKLTKYVQGRTQRGFEGVHQIQLGVWGAL